MIPGFWWRWMAWAGCLAAAWGLHAQAPARGVVLVPAAERAVLEEETARLFGVMFELLSTPGVRHELLPDVAIFHKAVDWSLRFDEFQHTNEIAEAHRMLKLGMERAEALRAGRPDWLMRTGLVVRGYMSRVDGSIQPYGVVVGGGYRPGGRLDVWLHGRDEKLTELRFLRERMKSVSGFPRGKARSGRASRD